MIQPNAYPRVDNIDSKTINFSLMGVRRSFAAIAGAFVEAYVGATKVKALDEGVT